MEACRVVGDAVEELLTRALAELIAAVAPGAAEREATRTLPYDAVDAFRASGLGTLRVPRAYGGPGGSVHDVIDVVLGIATVDSNLAQALRSRFIYPETLLAPGVPEAERVRRFPATTARATCSPTS